MSRFGWISVGIYVVLLATLGVLLLKARRNAVDSLDQPAVQQAWDEWRDEARRQDGSETPVKRRVPASAEPPALMLLRDHFAICVVGALLLTSLVYWASVFLFRGVMYGPKFEVGKRADEG